MNDAPSLNDLNESFYIALTGVPLSELPSSDEILERADSDDRAFLHVETELLSFLPESEEKHPSYRVIAMGLVLEWRKDWEQANPLEAARLNRFKKLYVDRLNPYQEQIFDPSGDSDVLMHEVKRARDWLNMEEPLFENGTADRIELEQQCYVLRHMKRLLEEKGIEVPRTITNYIEGLCPPPSKERR